MQLINLAGKFVKQQKHTTSIWINGKQSLFIGFHNQIDARKEIGTQDIDIRDIIMSANLISTATTQSRHTCLKEFNNMKTTNSALPN